MVVVPEHSRLLPIRIVVFDGFSRRIPVLRPTVALGWNSAAMNVHDRSRIRTPSLRTHEVVVDRKEMPGRQAIRPVNQNLLAALNLYRRPGHTVSITPEAGRRNVPVNFGAELLNRNSVKRNPHPSGRTDPSARRYRNRRDGERVNKRGQVSRVDQRRRGRHWRQMSHLRKPTRSGSGAQPAADHKTAPCNVLIQFRGTCRFTARAGVRTLATR